MCKFKLAHRENYLTQNIHINYENLNLAFRIKILKGEKYDKIKIKKDD